jgi:glutamate synthase (NADPH) small chain
VAATRVPTAWAPRNRQGAEVVHQFEIMPRPPEERPDGQPWPTYPMTFRVTSAHEEGGERVYSVNTEEFLGDDEGRVRR